jgi:hypothetical protein
MEDLPEDVPGLQNLEARERIQIINFVDKS